ncbi:hypothetical protein ACFY12_20615 [Streptomyces sp. NPDC001339]|uniref:hypothetical protein n=1 Tax=Streptomyces sp. NPDC001339 TaxID=3364563 RepID=UPI00368DA912
MTTSERGQAAARLLEAQPHRSDRAIASAVGLSARTVAELRRRVAKDAPQPAARVGRDGRVRPVNSERGRLLAAEYLTANPEASLRAAARAAGISPGTVRDVRDRLRRGEHPVPAARPRSSHEKSQEHRRPGTTPGNNVHANISVQRALHSLGKDPSLRSTEAGRKLLRLLASQPVSPAQRRELVESLPPYHLDMLWLVSRECAAVWQDFAGSIEAHRRRIEGGPGPTAHGA